MRVLSAVAVLLLTLPSPAQEPEELRPRDFKVGQVGHFRSGSTQFVFRVVRIIDADKMILRLQADFNQPFMVRGMATKGQADGQEIPLPGLWRIADTVKVSGRTVFVVVPHKAK